MYAGCSTDQGIDHEQAAHVLGVDPCAWQSWEYTGSQVETVSAKVEALLAKIIL